jgi:hypothetical protein
MDWFPEYWALIAVAIAGATGIVGILWDVRDKTTHKITIWGRTLFCITILSTAGAFVAQVLANRASEARNKKAQEETIQLLTHTRQGIVELSRILQPLDQPTIVLSVDLACGATAYQAFCSSAQSQAAEAHAEIQKRMISIGSVVEGSIPNFDWSTWPNHFGPFFPLMRLRFFKTKNKFEEYAKGDLWSNEVDMTFRTPIITSEFTPFYSVRAHDFHISFKITLKDARPEMNNTEVMSVPDLQGAVVAVYEPYFFAIFNPTEISIQTPKGQSMRGQFHVRETTSAKVFFAELSATTLARWRWSQGASSYVIGAKPFVTAIYMQSVLNDLLFHCVIQPLFRQDIIVCFRASWPRRTKASRTTTFIIRATRSPY